MSGRGRLPSDGRLAVLTHSRQIPPAAPGTVLWMDRGSADDQSALDA